MPLIRAAALELLRPVEINDLALNTTLYYAADLSFTALDIGLASALFGIVTLLVILAVMFLIRKGLYHTYVRILLPSALLLYGSTILYTASLASHIISINRLVTQAQSGLFSTAFTTANMDAFESDVLRQSWMMTIAVSVNVLIGDSIVWWRVCVVWRNRIVYCLGPLLIVLTIAFGAKTLLDVHHCAHSCRQPQFLFEPGVFADMCAILSLAINLIATGLIGYKGWAHWRLLRRHLGPSGAQKSRAVKTLALLVESGAIYCILLIIMVVYKATPALFAAPDVHQNVFFQAIAYYTYACFTYVIVSLPSALPAQCHDELIDTCDLRGG
ncbi:hypothetical protein V8D89_003728 [Ganoderma adspersum]